MSQELEVVLEYDGSKPLKDPKDERFCQEAIASNSLHQAYLSIGLKRPRGNAERMARRPHIEKRLSFLWGKAAQAAELLGARHLVTLDRIADANIFNFWDIDPESGSLSKLNLAKVPHVMGSVIQEISYDSKGRPKLKLHDAVLAAKFLVERSAPKPQRLEHSGPNGGPIQSNVWVTDADRIRALTALFNRAKEKAA